MVVFVEETLLVFTSERAHYNFFTFLDGTHLNTENKSTVLLEPNGFGP